MFEKIEFLSKTFALTLNNFDNEFFFFSFDEVFSFSSFDESFSKKKVKKNVKKKKRVSKSIITKTKQKVAKKKKFKKEMNKNDSCLLNIWRCDFDFYLNIIKYCWQSYDKISTHYNLNSYWIEKWNKNIANQKFIVESLDNELKERLINMKETSENAKRKEGKRAQNESKNVSEKISENVFSIFFLIISHMSSLIIETTMTIISLAKLYKLYK